MMDEFEGICKKKVALLGGLVVAVITILLFLSLVKIPAGFVGVVYSPNGGVKSEVLNQGWHLVNPMHKVTEYTIAVEQVILSDNPREGANVDESFLIGTSDNNKIKVNFVYSYRFDPDKVVDLFNMYRGKDGKTLELTIIRGQVRTMVGEVSAKYAMMEIYGADIARVNDHILKYVQEKFEGTGIVFTYAAIVDRRVDRATEEAINTRIKNIQELANLKIDSEKAEITAKNNKIEAEGRATVSKINATMAAEIEIINATAKAEANEILSKSLTKDLIQLKTIEKWDGAVPKVSSGGTSLINVGI
ncbi:MAG: SPFH domain-containing protein [Cetobacterium sp.]|uniref:SPFH domain-containing protein n=1 Tax=Cetobacterium sp. TaxID=2071632 RepID=UPI003F3E6DAF